MECEQLKNYGQLLTAKPSAKVLMASITSVPAELGILGTPKFLAKLASKGRYWKKRKFKAPEERGIANPDVLEGIQSNVLAFYTALIATCGEEKAPEIYAKGSERMGLMMYEEFFPSAKDFSRCEDTWGAFAQYLLEFLRTWEREGVARFDVIHNTNGELQVRLTDCALNAIYQEAGFPELLQSAVRPTTASSPGSPTPSEGDSRGNLGYAMAMPPVTGISVGTGLLVEPPVPICRS
jgi:hypothetical protein